MRAGENGPELLIALIKNPVGASETVRMLTEQSAVGSRRSAREEGREPRDSNQRPATSDQRPATSDTHSKFKTQNSKLSILVAINDRYADGTDVSWLWDAEFERLAGAVEHVTVSGTRAEDMAVRLKYAGVEPERIASEPDLAHALDNALTRLPADETLYVLPTYTAMLELRSELARRGWVRPFWEE